MAEAGPIESGPEGTHQPKAEGLCQNVDDRHKGQSLKDSAAKGFLKVLILTYQQGKEPSLINKKQGLLPG